MGIFTYVYLTALENFKTSWMKEDKEDWKKFHGIECEKFLKEFKKWYKGKEMPVEHSCDRASCQRNLHCKFDLKQSKENRSILSKELGLGNSYYKRKFDRLTGTPFKKNKKKSNIIMHNNNNNTPPSNVSSFDVFSLHQNFSTTLNEKKEKKQLLNGSNILLKYFNTIQSCCFLSPGEKDLQCLILNADQLNEFKGFFKTSIGKVRFRPYKDLYIFTYVYLT